MKAVMGMLALFLSFGVAMASGGYDIFDEGEGKDFTFERFSEANIWKAIEQDEQTVCKEGVCTLHSSNMHGRDVTLELRAGVGNDYYGNGAGTTIYTGDGYVASGDDEYYGVVARVTWYNCSQDIKVPRTLYRSMNRYMAGLVTVEGKTKSGLTPIEEAMMMFYRTIMTSADGCDRKN